MKPSPASVEGLAAPVHQAFRSIGRALWLGSLAIALVCLGSDRLAAQRVDPLDTEAVPRLDTEVLVGIGDRNGRPEHLFYRIQDAAILASDAFAVLDGGSAELRVFGTDGELNWKVGGHGGGPGEFLSPRRISLLSTGRLMVWDGRQQRATLIGPTGEVESTASVDLGPMARLFAGFVGALQDGSWVQRIEINPIELRDEPDGPRRDSVAFRRIGPQGHEHTRLASVDGPRRVLLTYSSVSWVRESPIFGRDLISAMRGDTLLLLHTDSLVVTRIVASDGTKLAPWRLVRPPRPVDPELVEARRRQLIAAEERKSVPGDGAALGMNALRTGRIEALRTRKIIAERSLPAAQDLIVASDGTVWVREFRPPDQPEAELWFRMDSAFTPDGWVELPEGARLVAAGHGVLLTVVEDELDVESVVVHRIESLTPR